MRIDYSKPSIDIRKETLQQTESDRELYERQIAISQTLKSCDDRKSCVLCNTDLTGEGFIHRRIDFICCGVCGHIQTKVSPPKNYPFSVDGGTSFNKIYPQLSLSEYKDRKKRIYSPKLEWIVSCLKDMGYDEEQLKELPWIELGCGAGYFLSALKDFGLRKFYGVDADETLISNANEFLNHKAAFKIEGGLEDGLVLFPADIYAAFFVLEHLESPYYFFQALSKLKKNTVFAFSVPVFGFSCLVEGLFENNYARNLDCVVHTQLFTDESIAYAMKMAGYEIRAQWIFGQDSEDLIRIFVNNIKKNLPLKLQGMFREKLLLMTDGMQGCLDKLHFSDQRHIIAIKN